jgi:hypothetical protein
MQIESLYLRSTVKNTPNVFSTNTENEDLDQLNQLFHFKLYRINTLLERLIEVQSIS